MIEIYFSILIRRLLRRGELDSREHLAKKILLFTDVYNRTAKPFRWFQHRTCVADGVGEPAESRGNLGTSMGSAADGGQDGVVERGVDELWLLVEPDVAVGEDNRVGVEDAAAGQSGK